MTIEITPTHRRSHRGRTARRRLAERLRLGQFIAGVELLTVELGRRLGLYATLAAARPVTAAELAERAASRGATPSEWLDQQAAAGIVDVAGSDVPTRRSRGSCCRPAHAAVLLDPESPAYLMGAAPLLLGLAAHPAHGRRRVRHRARGRVRRLRRRAAARHRRAQPPGRSPTTSAAGSSSCPTSPPRLDRGGDHPRRRVRRGLVDASVWRARSRPPPWSASTSTPSRSRWPASHVAEAGLADRVRIVEGQRRRRARPARRRRRTRSRW